MEFYTIMNMVKTMDYFSEELILINQDYPNFESLLKAGSKVFFEKGYVKESFACAVIEREKEYPTGLQTELIPFAIPHTDADHVIKPGILIMKLNNPISVKEMTNLSSSIDAKLIFLIAAHNDGSQVNVLRLIISMCTDFVTVNEILLAKRPYEIYKVIEKFITNHLAED